MLLVRRLSISPERGAETVVYLASSPEVEAVSSLNFAWSTPVTPSPAARELERVAISLTSPAHASRRPDERRR